MLKKFLIICLTALMGLGIFGWLNRTEILRHVVLKRVIANHYAVADYTPVNWQIGPKTADLPVEKRPPNIIFILLDDVGINDISTFGGGLADGQMQTPNIDKLAADGAIFTQAYTGSATCAPSRAMLLTGRYPTRTGFEFTPLPEGMGRVVATLSNHTLDRGHLPPIDFNAAQSESLPYQDQGLPTSEVTIAEVLQDKGYHTVHIGKWHLGRREGFRPNAQGFDESLLMHGGLFLPEGDPNVVNAKLDFDPIDQFLWAAMQFAASFNGGEPFKPGGYLTDWWTDESLKVIENNRHRPFFLYLAHWAVHTPLQATKADYDAVGDITPHRHRVYAAMMRALDRSVGRIMDKLEAEGLADNTLLVLSSDNGGASYIGLPDLNAPYRGWKMTLFEGGIRAPMFVKWPAKIPQGQTIQTPVAHIDVMPTLAAAGGASLPEGVVIDGQNILPAAMGEGQISRPNDAIFWQSGYYQVVRAGDWKLHIDERQGKSWLFNLVQDPTEQANLAASEVDKLAELSELLRRHQADAIAPLYPYSIESPRPLDKSIIDDITAEDEYIWWPN